MTYSTDQIDCGYEESEIDKVCKIHDRHTLDISALENRVLRLENCFMKVIIENSLTKCKTVLN